MYKNSERSEIFSGWLVLNCQDDELSKRSTVRGECEDYEHGTWYFMTVESEKKLSALRTILNRSVANTIFHSV
jgi:hypothetical protein